MTCSKPQELAQRLAGENRLWLFLDYDGTLADFAPTPDEINPDPELIRQLEQLAALPGIRIAVISGRKLSHIQALLPVPGIWLAGTYGADLWTPDGQIVQRLDRATIRPILDSLKPNWNKLLAGKNGFYLEDKDWSLALHARFATPDQAEDTLTQARRLLPVPLPESLHLLEGDRFLEIGPAQVDKARTVEFILTEDLWSGAALVYAGDDDKDELAFRFVQAQGGLAVVVGQRLVESQADICLDHPAQVRQWLYELAWLRSKGSSFISKV
jgi:trehalose 6-phosphate phosphatase